MVLKMRKLNKKFYLNPSVTEIAQSLLGKVLCTQLAGSFSSGRIVEVEAYSGRDDKACHANNNKRTKRTEIMYHTGGVAYVYLIYGMYHLFNVVSNQQDRADAVLIRALEPIDGIDIMMERMKVTTPKKITSGPGKLSKAMGITNELYGADLSGNYIWIADDGLKLNPTQIVQTSRIGVEYAEEDALKPWRFYIDGNAFVSRIKSFR
jgi:DNA-3-methyladenine glycosylase